MVSLFIIWQLTNVLLVLPCQAFILCAFGYSGSNIYLYGKNTYFVSWDSLTSQEYYKSDAVPVEADRSVYIWLNGTDGCYNFLTLPSLTSQGKHIPIAGMTIHATCNDCTAPNPESCEEWHITNEGNSTTFKLINTNSKCQPDNWITNNTLTTPQNQPPDICMHNTDQYNAALNDQDWQLFSVDPHHNPYYYQQYKSQYLTQYHHTATQQWYWIQYEIKPSSHRQSIAYCQITTYPTQSIIDCTPWYYQSLTNSSQYLLYNIDLNAHDCDFISNNICVYDSQLPYNAFNKDINGDYSIYIDNNDYDGFTKPNGGLAYIRFVENTWKFGYNYDLNEFIFSTCNNSVAQTQINPFDITSCNGYWQLPNEPCCDTLTISNTQCVDRPTRSPTYTPSNSPSAAPTFPPTASPSVAPVIAPSTAPSQQPTSHPTRDPTTMFPSISPSETPSISPVQSHSGFATLWDEFDPSSDNFILLIAVCAAIVFLCLAMAFSMYVCHKRRHKKHKHKKRVQAQKERDTFRERITMDVSEKVTNAVSHVVAKTTKEVILESIHGSVMRSPSPNMNMYGRAQIHTLQPGSHSNSNALHPHLMPIQQCASMGNSNTFKYLSPNNLSSTIPLSSPNQKVSIDEIYNGDKSPYTHSNAVLSPYKSKSTNVRERGDEMEKNVQFLIYEDDNIPDIPASSDNISVNYDDAHMDEKENRVRLKKGVILSVKGIHKISDVFPDDDEGAETHAQEGHDNETKSVGYNHLKQIEKHLILNNKPHVHDVRDVHVQEHYNSSSEQDEDEKYEQNEATLRRKASVEIEMQNRGSEVSMPYDKYEQLHGRNQTHSSQQTASYNDVYPHEHEHEPDAQLPAYSQPNIYHPLQSNTKTNNMSNSRYLNDGNVDKYVQNALPINKYSNKPDENMNDEAYFKLMEKIMLDKSSSVGDRDRDRDVQVEENDDIGPLHHNTPPPQKQYRQQIQFGQQLSPIMNAVGSQRISQSEMSDSRRTGKSFITLVEEQKQIEISNMDDDGLDDDSEDQIENSPLLSSNNNGDEFVESSSSTCDEDVREDELEEFDIANKSYAEYIGQRNAKHPYGVRHVQVNSASFNQVVVENPFKIMDGSNMSFSTTQNDADAKNEDESFDFNDSTRYSHGHVVDEDAEVGLGLDIDDDVTVTTTVTMSDQIEIQHHFDNNPIVKGYIQ